MTLIKRSRIPVRRSDTFGQLFDDFFNDWNMGAMTNHSANENDFIPAINLKEDQEAYTVEAELPGMNKDEIEVTIKDHTLHLKGQKQSFDEETKEDYHRIERRYGSF